MKIGKRGQIAIPKLLREKYGLFPDIEIEFISEETGIRIQKKTSHSSPPKEVLWYSKKKGKNR